MTEDDGSREEAALSRENDETLTRSALYDLVWAEPMLKVAARLKVSSSYMARVCTVMNVPRPERGYWAKLAVGQQPSKPELPDLRPGDQMIWNRGGASVPQSEKRPLPKAPAEKPKRKPKVATSTGDLHPLIHGAKEHFDTAKSSYDSTYLKPSKRLLVDLVVSMTGLDKALAFANQLFLELEAHHCRVVIAAHGERMGRPQVDENEIPRKNAHDDYRSSRLWSPGRITVAYVGTVAIGLTLVELSEQAEARYVKGEYVRLDQEPAVKSRRYVNDYSWTTMKDYPTGRLCLHAYSPDCRGEWSQQWRETKGRDLASRMGSIMKELMEAAPMIAALIQEGERKAELRRQEWDRHYLEDERRRAEERAVKARQESTEEILAIVKAWADAKRIEEFFSDTESRLEGLDPDRRDRMRERLKHARDLIGSVDALELFARWKTPSER